MGPGGGRGEEEEGVVELLVRRLRREEGGVDVVVPVRGALVVRHGGSLTQMYVCMCICVYVCKR